MRFQPPRGDEYLEIDVVTCEGCDREISTSDDHGRTDISLCPGCAARRTQEHAKTLCKLCKKPLGTKYYYYMEDDWDIFAHGTCVENLSEKKKEEWCDDFD